MKLVNVLPLALLLAACAPLSIYHRAGVSVAQMRSDQTDCEVQALRDAPRELVTRFTPPRMVPTRTICRKDGTCVTRGGYFDQGRPYRVDANADLRARVEVQCMARKGYAPARIPACPADVARATPAAATVVLPPLTSESCFIRNRSGSVQILSAP